MPEKGFLWVDTPNPIETLKDAEKPAMLREVLVAGAGLGALAVIKDAAALGYPVTWAFGGSDPAFCGADEDPDQVSRFSATLPQSVELLPNCELSHLTGAAGDFSALLTGPGGVAGRRFGGVFLCPPAREGKAAYAEGLDQAKVISLDMLDPEAYSGSGDKWLHAAVLCGPDLPVTAPQFDRAVRAALALQQRPRVQAYLFFSEARVATEGGERRYRQARESGVIFVRLAPGGLKAEDGGALLTWTDPVLNETMDMAPDVLAAVPAYTAELPSFLENHTLWPPRHFLLPQGAVRLMGGKTARSGFYILGPVRGTAPGADRLAEAAAAMADLRDRLENRGPAHLPPVVHHEMCASCLTCVRVCPHGVPRFGLDQIECAPAACLACGVCAAECPAEAIAPAGWENKALLNRLALALQKGIKPEMVLFACRGSAVPALEALSASGYTWPLSMAVVPLNCVGRVGEQLILKALSLGAKGVLAAGCHDGNCRSVTGNLRAKLRSRQSAELLTELGLAKRVKFLHLASNQPAALARALEEMKSELEEI